MQRNTQFRRKTLQGYNAVFGKESCPKYLARYYPVGYNFAFQLTDDSESSLVNVRRVS